MAPQPIPVALSTTAGGLTALATVDGVTTPFTVTIDSGAAVTAYDDHTGMTGARLGTFRLFASTPVVPRLRIDNIQLFISPLRTLGVDGSTIPIGGVLGGDNLERFAVGFDYRPPTPTVTFTPTLTSCSCELATACQAVFPFVVAGGQEIVAVGGGEYNYPPSRVILDACLEPLPDPISANVVCASNSPLVPPAAPYLPSGIDVKVIVATGFPGFALSASAFDRLRGPGAAAAARARPAHLFLPDIDDNAQGAGLTVGTATLGDSSHSALALVSRELYFGPCAELARSRRQRRSPPDAPRPGERGCQLNRGDAAYYGPKVQAQLQACSSLAGDSSSCDDDTPAAHTAAVIELSRPLPTYVVDDTAPFLQSINADVRPGTATVEGVIGTEVLDRLVTTLDYPNGRVIARCADSSGCLTYPRYLVASQQATVPADRATCAHDSLCRPPSSIATAPLPGGLCAPLGPR